MKNKSLLIIFLSIIISFAPFTVLKITASENNEHRIIVTFEDKINTELLNNENIKIHHTFPEYNSVAITVPLKIKTELEKDNTVKAIEQDYEVTTSKQITDWGFTSVKANESHKHKLTGKGVKVGIIDSGINTNHPDLKIAGGISFIGSSQNYNDEEGHGTHVAGIVAAKDNDIGIIGVAPDVELYAIKVIGNDGLGNHSDVVKGIDWALTNNLDIINLSISTEAKSFLMEQSLNKAYEKGMLIIGASGNNLTSFIEPVDVLYPARYPSVISVGAINKNNERTKFSYYGNSLEFVAPGEDIISTYITKQNNNPYAKGSGTSMAAPFVTGVAALYKEAYPNLSNKQIRTLMQETARDLGEPGKDKYFGYGLVQAPVKKQERTFPDLIPNSYYEKAVINLAENKIVTGYVDGNFYPQKEVTRAEAITMIMRALNIEAENERTNYKDVPINHYASGKIARATELGIVTGYPNNNFGPSDLISRADTAVMLIRAYNIEETNSESFLDVEKDKYYTSAINNLKAAGITTGFTDGTYRPFKKITRAEFAVLLERIIEYGEGR